jgi:acyl-CoA thioesterase I
MNLNRAIFALAVIASTWAPAQALTTLACVGNSITAGTSGPSYVPILQTLLGSGYSVQNNGLGGTTLLRHGDAPYWTTTQFQNVFAQKPALITIKLGTNDSKSQNWNAHRAEFAGDLNALIDTFLTISPKPQIWLVLCAPSWPNGYGINGDTIDKDIVPIIRSVATQRNLPFIDCHTPFLNHSEFFIDGVHPNAAGADSIAHIFYHAILGKPIMQLSDSLITAVYYTGQAKASTTNKVTVINALSSVVHLSGPVVTSKKSSWLTLSVDATKVDSQVITNTIYPSSLPDVEKKYYDTVTVHSSDALVADLSYRVMVWVRQSPVLTSLSITPDSCSLPTSKPFRFTAVALDQYGQPMQSQPAMTWSCTGGSVDGAGLFTPQAAGGAARIIVNVTADGAIKDTANLSIVSCSKGINYKYYENVVVTGVNDIASHTATKSGITTTISLQPATAADSFALCFTGYLLAPLSGMYTFFTSSDDGSALFLDGKKVVDNDGVHGAQERSGDIALSAGLHSITVLFYEVAGGQSLDVSWRVPGAQKTAIPDSVLFYANGSTATRQPGTASNQFELYASGSFDVQQAGHGLAVVSLDRTTQWRLELFNLNGARIAQYKGQGNSFVPYSDNATGVLVARLHAVSGARTGTSERVFHASR